MSDQNKSTESTNAEAPTSSQHFGNALLPDALMAPRYKVIAKYPGMRSFSQAVGDIIKCSELLSQEYQNYPAVLKKLEWWEERKVEEIMDIKFVKIPHYPNGENDYTIEPVDGTFKKHDFTTFGYYGLMYRKGAGLIASMFTPATESEYLSYIEGLKK